ncbi:MAG: SMC-Scp complex subunit ScpB [Hormoscilla sp. SP12CHS1]|nr:SMC-Scp complex subunit ScpB [Hormoscilla sp. SP12CHS1]
MERLTTKIEAILYLKGKAMSIAEIANLAKCDKGQAKAGMKELMADYASRDSALEVVETPTGYSLQLRSDFQEIAYNLLPAELGVGALRTLAAIALSDKIAQSELVELRGSGAYKHVGQLVEIGLVKRQRQANGRSYSLQVTNKFHQYFQIEQLPTLTGEAVR